MRLTLTTLVALGAMLPGTPAAAQDFRSLATGVAPVTMNVTDYVLGNDRYEFRIHDLNLPVANDVAVFALGGDFPVLQCVLRAGTSTLRCVNVYEGTPNGLLDLNLSGRTDVRVRYQRTATNNGIVEVWNGDCSGYLRVTQPLLPSPAPNFSGTFRVGGANLAVAFLRGYTDGDTSSRCPSDVPPATAPRFDFRFENNSTADLAQAGRSLSGEGLSFVASPVYPPAPSIQGSSSLKATFRAGERFTLDGAGSVAFRGNGQPVRYRWQQLSGPAEAVFDSRSGTSATILAPVQGTYVFRLQVEDSAEEIGFLDWEVGIVATDRQGTVVLADGDWNFILGPLTRHGVNPWPWYDVAEAAGADALLPYMLQPLTGSTQALGGTVSVLTTNNSIQDGQLCCNPIVTGQDTHFTSDLQVNDAVWIWWDRAGDGSNQGRTLASVKEILSDTAFRINDYYWPIPPEQSLNMNISKAGPDSGGYTLTLQPSTSWNYYEALLGIYRLYFRTGLERYREQARQFCEQWFTYGLDSGYRLTVPRNSGWHSMMACALDFRPEWWGPLARNLSRNSRGVPDILNPATPVKAGAFDLREAAYITRSTALMAKLYPPRSTNPEAKRTEWCGYLTNQVQHLWLAGFTPIGTRYGYWQEDVFGGNTDFPLAPVPPPLGQFGTSPWRANGLINLALIKAHEVFSDANACPNAELAGQVEQMIQKSASFVWDYARSADGGVFYNVLYETQQGQNPNKPVTYGSGSISLISGSATVTGVGTSFQSLFAPCDGSTYLGVRATGDAFRRIYRVTGCPSDTTLTLHTAHVGPSQSGITVWNRSYRASSDCGPYSLAPYCEPDQFSGKNLSHDLMASFGWLFYRTKDAIWKDRLDYFGGRSYGGSAKGPGIPGPPAGPQADGQPNNFDYVLPPCGLPPCGEPGRAGGPTLQLAKPFGMSAGAGDAPNAFAYRLGGLEPPDPGTVALSFSLPAGASQVRYEVTAPTGVRSTYTCSNSPCSVAIDRRLGSHLILTEYLDAQGAVLSRGKRRLISAPE